MPEWTYTGSWDRYAHTAGVILVRRALDRGLAGSAAIDFINTQPEIAAYHDTTLPDGTVLAGGRAAVTAAGAKWSTVLMWYAKRGPALTGNFQVVAPDGPFVRGWSVRWAPESYVDGPAPAGFPVGPDGKHPTAWELVPEGDAYEPSVPVPPIPGAEPPVPPAPPAPPDAGDVQLAQFVRDVGVIADGVTTISATLVALLQRVNNLDERGVRLRFK